MEMRAPEVQFQCPRNRDQRHTVSYIQDEAVMFIHTIWKGASLRTSLDKRGTHNMRAIYINTV